MRIKIIEHCTFHEFTNGLVAKNNNSDPSEESLSKKKKLFM